MDGPTETLIPQEGEPVREQERVCAARVFTTPKGERVIDFGQELTGFLEVSVDAKAGEVVDVSFAEVLDKDGNFYTENYRGAKCQYHYTCRDGQQTYKTKLTFYGFRYIRVNEFPGGAQKADLSSFTGIAVHSQMKRTGYIRTSDPMVNQLFSNIIWGQKSNFVDVPTDCPQRDERLGWLNDMTVRNEGAMYGFRLYQMYAKWLRDIRDTQGRVTGAITDTAPFLRYGFRPADPVSGSFLLLPWNLYLHYGDDRIIRENYDANARWVRYLMKNTRNGVVRFSSMVAWRRFCSRLAVSRWSRS